MGGKTKKTAAINIRVPPELKEAAERAAAKDRRSLTSLIEKLLDDHLREIGQPIGKPGSKRKLRRPNEARLLKVLVKSAKAS